MPTLREWLQHSPFTLSLSSGYFSLFAHCGMVSVLEQAGLHPARICGASSGALVGGCWAAGCSTGALKEVFFGLKERDFWDLGWGWGLIKGDRFRQIVASMCPIKRLEECPLPVRISVFDVFSCTTHLLSNGPVADAVYASCAVPGLFQPIRIDGRLYLDGGIRDQPGLAGAPDGTRVLHQHIPMRKPWPLPGYWPPFIPKRNNMIALAAIDLIRVGPNRLSNGRHAYQQGRVLMKKALDTPLPGDRLFLNASEV